MNYSVFLIIFGLPISGIICSDWNYDNQDKWPELCSTGKSQSPIDLNLEEAVEESFDQFVFHNYDFDFSGIVQNNGHTVTVKLVNIDSPPAVEGGGLDKEYTLDHLHFHWGSEHTINSRRYPLEVHLVHFATEYENISTALDYEDGIAVLGVFYELSPDDDIYLEPLMEVMDNVTETTNTSAEIEMTSPNHFLPRDTAGLYRYNGSLTTPGCNEVVIWTLFTNTLPISKKQVEVFQSLQVNEGLTVSNNFRPVQDLNGRSIYLKVSPIPDKLETTQKPKETEEEIQIVVDEDRTTKESDCNCENSNAPRLMHSFILQFGVFIVFFNLLWRCKNVTI